MKRLINTLFFLSFALVIHLVLAALRQAEDGASAAGDGGESVMSVEASTASIAALVAAWETVPEVSDAVLEAPQVLPPQAPALSQPPRPEPAPRPQLAALLPPTMPQPPAPRETPLASPAPAPPPPEQRPDPEAKPEPKPKPAPRPKPPAPAQSNVSSAQERAAGQGGGTQAGEAQSARDASTSKARQQSLQAQWGASIRARIDRRKRAPRGGGSGTVVLSVSVAPSGALLAVSVRKSSGDGRLDQAALTAAQAAGRFAKAPKELTQPRYTFSLPVRFTG